MISAPSSAKMIDNQNLLFRPWQWMAIDPATCAFTPDIQNLKCEFTSLQASNCRPSNRLPHRPSQASKKITDAERLKQTLLSEGSRETDRQDRKSSIKKELPNEIPRPTDPTGSQIKSNAKTSSPASSSAETRLINSRIAALSSATHLLNLDSYGRIAPPINDNQLAVAAAAAAAAAASNSSTNPLNFLLPNGNLPPTPNNSLPLPSLPNNLPAVNNLPNGLPGGALAPNGVPTDKCILPEVHPSQLLSVHKAPPPNPAAGSTLPNGLANIALPPPAIHSALPRPPAPLMSVPNSLPQTPSVSFNSKQWSEMVASVSANHLPNGNLLTAGHCLPPPISSALLENGQFASLNDLPTDILMANLKKSHTIQAFKKNRPKKFVCTVGQCDSSFANNGQLKNHIRSHTGERPFACDHLNCNKRFTRNEELTRHKKIHSGEKPYPCQICKKKFGRKDHLKKHVKTHERAATQQQFAIPYFPYLYFPKL